MACAAAATAAFSSSAIRCSPNADKVYASRPVMRIRGGRWRKITASHPPGNLVRGDAAQVSATDASGMANQIGAAAQHEIAPDKDPAVRTREQMVHQDVERCPAIRRQHRARDRYVLGDTARRPRTRGKVRDPPGPGLVVEPWECRLPPVLPEILVPAHRYLCLKGFDIGDTGEPVGASEPGAARSPYQPQQLSLLRQYRILGSQSSGPPACIAAQQRRGIDYDPTVSARPEARRRHATGNWRSRGWTSRARHRPVQSDKAGCRCKDRG